MDWEKVSGDLSKKLDPAHVRPAKQYGPKGDYIEGWHAMAEANRIFGFGEWDYALTDCKCVSERPKKIGKDGKDGWAVSYIATVQVFVGSVRRQDVGAGHGYDLDCGLAHESAIKEAVTDALKRALRSFGSPFGLALYDKTRENVGIDLPPFDARAAADRVIAKLKGSLDMADLAERWKSEAATIADVKEADAAMFAEINATKEGCKAEMQPPKEQAA